MSRAPSDTAKLRIRRARAIGLTAAGLLALALGVYLAFATGAEEKELPILGEMPPFELQSHRGEEVSAGDLRGPLIANFIFTRCPTVCPVFTMKMQRIQEQTEDVGSELQLLSFSVDPEYDTPERLAAYAEEYGADPQRWTFLTGEPEEVRQTLRDGLYIAMDPVGELPSGAPDIAHSTHFVLFDADLKVRGYYDSNDPERLKELVRDARRLVK